MRKRITVYWAGWLSLIGCAVMAVSFAFGGWLNHWQQYVWLSLVAMWSVNWMTATKTSRTYERLWQVERQRNRSMWS